MKATLFLSVLCVLVLARADMTRIADILTAESTELKNCDLIKQNSHLNSLGHRIAQVVCDEQTSTINRRFIGFMKYVLFGIICSISTYLLFVTNDSKTVDFAPKGIVENEGVALTAPQVPVVEKQVSECVKPVVKAVRLEKVKLHSLNVLPEKKPRAPAETETDLSLERKSLDSTNDTAGKEPDKKAKQMEGKAQGVEHGNVSDYLPPHPPVLNLEAEQIADFEGFKTNIDCQRYNRYFRPRSFSDPKGLQRFAQYPFTIEDNGYIGENPETFTLPLTSLPSHLEHECLDGMHEPVMADMMNSEQKQQQPVAMEGVPPEQKINERKPMVFVGGVSASTTPLELVTELKKQGFNVTVVPRIRYGVSFGFCPDLVLSSQAEVEKLLSMGRVWVKDRWVDIRPYIPKEEPQQSPQPPKNTQHSDASLDRRSRTPPQQAQTSTQNIHDVVENKIEYISHEDLMSSCPTSPAPSQNATPPVGNSSPVTPSAPQQHFMMNPPFIQMTPVFPLSPGNYNPHHMVQPHFFPPPQAHPDHFQVFSPHHQMSAMHSPSPPEQHPIMFEDNMQVLSPSFQSMGRDDHLQHPLCNPTYPNRPKHVFKIVSN